MVTGRACGAGNVDSIWGRERRHTNVDNALGPAEVVPKQAHVAPALKCHLPLHSLVSLRRACMQ